MTRQPRKLARREYRVAVVRDGAARYVGPHMTREAAQRIADKLMAKGHGVRVEHVKTRPLGRLTPDQAEYVAELMAITWQPAERLAPNGPRAILAYAVPAWVKVGRRVSNPEAGPLARRGVIVLVGRDHLGPFADVRWADGAITRNHPGELVDIHAATRHGRRVSK